MNRLDPIFFTTRFYQTLPHACSYLDEQEATTLFLDPQQPVTLDIYDKLTQVGFRRSGKDFYRPHCQTCNACKSARVRVADFKPSRQQRRTLNKNQDLSWEVLPAVFKNEHYQLYKKYINQRHADGSMYPAHEEQYRSFLLSNKVWASLVEFRAPSGKLLAVAAVDKLTDGLSAIYTFFDPDENQRSLGVYAVLWQLEQAASLELPYVYLGYWIKNCRKMNYKEAYQPLEISEQQQWRPFYKE